MTEKQEQLDIFSKNPFESSDLFKQILQLQSELDRTRKSAFAKITDLVKLVSDLQARMMYLEGELSLKCYNP